MDLGLAGKIALVTGAGSGIGRAVAECLGAEGCTLRLADLKVEAARETARAIDPIGARAIACDVSDPTSVAALVDAILARDGRIDILVNSAGVLGTSSFLDSTLEEWRQIEKVNLAGVLYCCKSVAPAMIAQRSGRIVNIASVSAYRGGGSIGNVLYGASKAGVIALTMGMARELGPAGVTVNAVAPAVMLSPMTRAHLSPDAQQAIERRIPLGRLGAPSDTASLVAFLCSQRASFISGAAIPVDGALLTT